MNLGFGTDGFPTVFVIFVNFAESVTEPAEVTSLPK